MSPFLLPLIAFFCGSVPFGLLIAKAKGIDIRVRGSGNIGTTNVFRVVGKVPGIACLLLDFLKGFLPVILAVNLCRPEGASPVLSIPLLMEMASPLPGSSRLFAQTVQVLSALAAVLGHNYSPWLAFKGGKGIATMAGTFAALMPFAIPFLIAIWALVTFGSGFVSLGSMTAAAALPIFSLLGSWHHGKIIHGAWNIPLFLLCLAAALLAIWSHRTNIRNLLQGTEHRIRWKKQPSPRQPVEKP